MSKVQVGNKNKWTELLSPQVQLAGHRWTVFILKIKPGLPRSDASIDS